MIHQGVFMIKEKINSIKKVNEKTKVYDIAVEEANHYILDNGIITHNSYVPTNEISGGSGFKFAATTIAMLSKKKDREGTDVVGNLITVKMYKSRLSKENQQVQVRLSYSSGLDRYYGLSEIAEEAGVFEKVGNKLKMPDGKTIFEKALNREPEKYYTQEVLDAIENQVKKKFAYGSNNLDAELEEVYEEEE